MVVIIVLPVFLFSTAHENFFYQKMENGKLLFSKKGGGKKIYISMQSIKTLVSSYKKTIC